MWINILETIYKTVKGWMKKQIDATENKDFIAKWDEAFKLVDGLLEELKIQVKK